MILGRGACLILIAILVVNLISITPLSTKQSNAMEGLLPQYEPLQHISTNPNLYVSAENPLFKNYFAGPMVIEVIVSDPNISRLDQSYGEPVVTVNGKRLRMAQATDGNWYAYFADRNQAELAGKTAPVAGHGLNFGWFCGPRTVFSVSSPNAMKQGVEYSQTNGFTIARNVFHNGTVGDPQSPALLNVGTNPPDCNINSYSSPTVGVTTEHVIRKNETLNTNSLGFNASNTYEALWPVIQLYDFSSFPTPVTVDYRSAGGDQAVNLIFDRIPSNEIAILADRPDFPRGAQVQGDLLDPQLNIDPTDIDSWTWGTSPTNNTLYYMAFGKDGKSDADGLMATGSEIMPGFGVISATPMQNLIGNLTAFMFNHNGRLLEDAAPQGVIVARLQSNGIQTLFADNNGFMRTQSINAFSIPITASELQPNAGIFSDYDEGGISDLVILDNAERDKSFTIIYNDIAYSIVVKFHNAKLTMG
ncbi:MAG: hypothetical protein KGI25_03220 [Thaumarchaeota archaeon]|nr:hypothetical protein [Nitrososphaerota archaeon]